MEYKCINFEGLDQVGKGDAVKNLSLEISKLGYNTCVISFPYYATPLGFLIRDILVNGFPEDIKVNKSREIEIKMVLFALNRLEILNCIFSDNRYDIYIFDRGPFSCALTIGYHISQHREDLNSMEYFVDKGLYFDSYFRDILNVDNCVIYLKHMGIEWKGSRQQKGDDLYEKSDVQRISANVYSILGKKVGKGWSSVVTKDKEGWRDRCSIKDECIKISKKRGVFGIENPTSGRRSLKYLGIKEVQKFLYIGSDVSKAISTDWISAIKKNDKKEVYRVSEIVSGSLVSTTEAIRWYDEEMVRFIKVLIKEYPEILDIIYNKYGKSFVDKFVDSLNEKEG